MYKLLLIYLFLIIMSPAIAATQLQAVLEEHEINQGETANLQIILSNADTDDTQPTADPDLTPLQGSFEVLSSSRANTSRSINGQTSTQVTWTYLIEPQQTGQLTLPAISLATTQGVLQTQPQTLIVNQGNKRSSDSPKLEASVSNLHPQLYEPVYYTMRFYHYGNLSELQAIPPTDNVILEPLRELTTNKRQQIDGKDTIVTEVVYLLTPTNPGKLELAASKIKGLKADNRSKSTDNFFNFSTSFRPFTTTSNSLTLDVQPATQQPWLPAQNVTLTQHWETAVDKTVTVGVPLVRTLVLTAEGVGAQPLPSLENLINNDDTLRVRSPKPETERKFQADHKTPVSTVTQTFSLIPLKAGDLPLPALRIGWWDTEKQVMRWAELPPQTLHVVENPNLVPVTPVAPPVQMSPAAPSVPEMLRFDWVQYGLLGLSLLALGIAWGMLRGSRRQPTVSTKDSAPTLSIAEFKRRMQATEQANEIQQLIQTFANQHWKLPRHTTLHHLAQQTQDAELATALKHLEATVYGQQAFDLTDKQQIMERLPRVKLTLSTVSEIPALLPLNPVI